jgi:hypothetical protein
MARTIEQIYNDLVLQKQTFGTLTGLTTISDYQTFLTNLTSDSKVSNWNLELYNSAVMIKTLEDKIETETSNISTLLSNSFVMTADWYRAQTLLFQYGDIVQLINYVPGYVSVDVDKQIIEFCSVEEIVGGVKIKVRRKDGTILSNDELLGLQSYLNAIKGIGTIIQIINLEPDDIKFFIDIIYTPQVNLDTLKTNVSDAITNYVSNLPFDSKIYGNDVIDILQEVSGVIDPRFVKISAKANTASTYVDYGWSYDLVAGYGIVQDIANTITYSV